jgi:Putative beta-barrel porin-2, OmpL-like. bbp2
MVRPIRRVALAVSALAAMPQPALADSGWGIFPERPDKPAPSVLASTPATRDTVAATAVPAAASASVSPPAPTPTPLLVAQLPPPSAGPSTAAAPAVCTQPVDPYKNYACLDPYLGDDVLTRLFNYYRLEWGEAGPPTDPSAPPGRRDYWPATPETTPPMPFTEWPYGGTTNLGVNRPASVDSPFMAAIANTSAGQWMAANNLQLYGWIDSGFNVSSNTRRPGGNAPIAYSYTPNTIQLDQAVLYFERTPDTVQKDHVDWGFRLSGIYGENYRYTTAYGIASYQLLKKNNVNGYDFPMVYGELFFPQVGEGLMLRLGRFISLPDIEAQLAPNNYMYSHSMTYSFDNYTNEGVQGTLAVTKELFLQLGVTVGTEAPPWHWGARITNLMPGNALYSGATMLKDPGAQPSVTGCVRYNFNAGDDNVNACADAINAGNWGYNNLQWYGFTAYHKFDDHWHISYEFYDLYQTKVPNLDNPVSAAIIAGGGTPFSPQFMPFNAPNAAHCGSVTKLRCTASALGSVAYINYSPDPLNNISFRPEYYDDQQGQRTGTKTRYIALALGWQHWLSPQIEFRPELAYYRSLDAPAFNANAAAGIPPNKNYTVIGQMDVILHF